MKHFKLATIALTFGLSGLAQASGGGSSEFWYAPKGGQNAIKFGYQSASLKTSTLKTIAGADQGTFTTSLAPIGLNYAYGLNDSNAFGIWTDVGTDTTKFEQTGGASADYKNTGMGDLHLYYNGNNAMGSWVLYYGADLGVSPAKHKAGTLNTNPTKNGDRYSGGMSLEPYVGFHFPNMIGSGSLGMKLSYAYLMERTETNQDGAVDTEDKVTGGSSMTLTPYYEMNFGPGSFDVYLAYTSASDADTKAANGTTSTLGARNTTALGVHGSYDIGAFTLLGEVAYASVSDWNLGSTLQKATATGTAFGIGGRFTF